MDVSPSAMVGAVDQMKQAQLVNEVRVNVFKKAVDIKAESVSQLIDSVPKPPPLATSGNLGTKLNVYA